MVFAQTDIMKRRRTFILIPLLLLPLTDGATVKDVFNLNTQLSSRTPRDNKYYPNRSNPSLTRALKPEESPEAHEATPTPVEKRCTRCDSTYSDSRYPYEGRGRDYDRRYRPSQYDYEDRRYDRYDERRYDRYDDRRPYDRYDRDRYDRDRNDGRDRYYDRYDRDRGGYDRYDRDRYYDRDYDRGFGYDNRGYDYRDRGYSDYQGTFSSSGYDGGRGGGYYSGGRPEAGGGGGGGGGSGYWGTGGYATGWNYGGGKDDRDRDRNDEYDGFKPWDETYKGSSGWDSKGRGYYFASGIPEVGADHWGTQEYADPDRDRYGGGGAGAGGGGGGGGGGGYYRPRDPYDGYRSTSYLYGRPSSTTTDRPNGSDGDSTASSNSQDNSSG